MAPGNRKKPQRSRASDSQYTIQEFFADFPDDETCLVALWRLRYSTDGEHATCPKCDKETVFKRYANTAQQRQDWTCTACGHHIHPTAGTIFHKSSTGLHLWFYAMYLMSSTRCGISAKQLERELGVTYKTAWRMFTLIRNQLMTQDGVALASDVEMDETFIGGKPRLADKRGFHTAVERGEAFNVRQAAQRWSDKKKTPVFGMVERSGQIAAYVVPSVRYPTLKKHIDKHVAPDSTLYTDDGAAYRGMTKRGWKHHVVNHSDKVYVVGDVHTQTIDGFWFLLKSGIIGTHHSVSRKWLQGYLNEYVWRYNHRHDNESMFASLVLNAALVD